MDLCRGFNYLQPQSLASVAWMAAPASSSVVQPQIPAYECSMEGNLLLQIRLPLTSPPTTPPQAPVLGGVSRIHEAEKRGYLPLLQCIRLPPPPAPVARVVVLTSLPATPPRTPARGGYTGGTLPLLI